MWVFLYIMRPLKHISLTASIFMTTLLAYERKLAVVDPIGHRIAMESRRARRIKLGGYIACVVAASIALNVTKFMEFDFNWDNYEW